MEGLSGAGERVGKMEGLCRVGEGGGKIEGLSGAGERVGKMEGLCGQVRMGEGGGRGCVGQVR